MNIDHLCMGCMFDKGDTKTCPVCGWSEKDKPESPLHLHPRAILNGMYLIGRVLGHGGFGITYLAWDLNLHTIRAIKEYFPHNFATRQTKKNTVVPLSGAAKSHYQEGLDKFVEEARALEKFTKSPGIVTVHNFFPENGTYYMVMEYVDGVTFKEYVQVKGDKIDWKDALQIINRVIESLKEVHSAGMLHRDITPNNIKITGEGKVYFLDFGSARYTLSQNLTVMWTKGFSPPEQCYSNGKQGPWTDVYGVAATLYWAITGKTPFIDSDILVPPSALGIHIPPGLEKVLLKALAQEPNNRYQTMLEFAQALDKCATSQRVTKVHVKEKNRTELKQKWLWPVIAVPLIIVLLVFSGYWFSRGSEEEAALSLVPDSTLTAPQNPVENSAETEPEQMPVEVEVPNLQNLPLQDAEQILIEKGLIGVSERMYDNEIPEGVVISQNPLPGNLIKPQDIITLQVSAGVKLIRVPDVVSLALADAISQLQSAGLKEGTIKKVENSQIARDHVIKQSISAGSEVKEATGIDLEISEGIQTIALPALDKKTLEEAKKILANLGFTVKEVKTYSNSVAQNLVISQSPKAGTLVRKNSRVTITISLGVEPVKLPPETPETNVSESETPSNGTEPKPAPPQNAQEQGAGDVVEEQKFSIEVEVVPNEAGIIRVKSLDGNRILGFAEAFKGNGMFRLTVQNSQGYEFDHWEGDLSGTDTMPWFKLDQNKKIRAFFKQVEPPKAPQPAPVPQIDPEPISQVDPPVEESPVKPLPEVKNYKLSVEIYPPEAGSVKIFSDGAVTLDYSSIKEGSSVRMYPTPSSAKYTFDHWEGDSEGKGFNLSLKMNCDKVVRAVFKERTTGTKKAETSENQVTPVELIQDGEFANGSLYWKTAMRQSGALVQQYIESKTGHSWIELKAEKSNDVRIYQEVKVTPYTDYVLSGWIYTENVKQGDEEVKVGANLAIERVDRQETVARVGKVFGTTNWTYYSIIFSSGSNKSILVEARLGGYSGCVSGTAYFDKISLKAKGN